MKTKEIIFHFLILSVALAVQASVFPVFFSDFSVPKIILMLIIAWVIKDGFIQTLPWIITAGFLLDIISYTPVGASVIFFVLISYAANLFFRKFLFEGGNWEVPATFLFIIAATVFYRVFLAINFSIAREFSKTIAESLVFFRHLGSEAALNCLLFFLILFIFKKKNEKILSVKKI